jgi:hypothetical protein
VVARSHQNDPAKLPTIIHACSLTVEVVAILLGPQQAPSGPQLMHILHRFNPTTGRRDRPVEGWRPPLILYLDAPELHAEAVKQ